MPQPVLIGSIVYLRLHVPSDVVSKTSGTTVAIPVGERISQVKLTTHAKASPRTTDWR